jgi:hypothetical protein
VVPTSVNASDSNEYEIACAETLRTENTDVCALFHAVVRTVVSTGWEYISLILDKIIIRRIVTSDMNMSGSESYAAAIALIASD